MKIHYLSHHSVLEYDEVKLFTELGHDVKANGVYRDPRGHYDLPRPGIPGMKFDQDWLDITAQYSAKTDLPPEMIEPFDVLIFMSGQSEKAIISNWDRIKHKRVIWRTIGQSTRAIEIKMQRLRDEGLEIVRYSPKEAGIPNYCGGDAVIRFYKDPEEFKGWTGEKKTVVNFSQSLKARRDFLHYDVMMASITGFDAKIYGTGNEDLGSLNGGSVTYDRLKEIMRESRVMVYTGTWPASYTLGFIEAMMTGLPIVAISKAIAHSSKFEALDFYEVDEMIPHNDDVKSMRDYIQMLLNDHELAKTISRTQRSLAIKLFGKDKIAQQWADFLAGNYVEEVERKK